MTEALGHSTAQSGGLKVKVGALTHYGLLARQGGVYSISPLGRRILRPTEIADYKLALADAAKAPTLYAELVRDFAGRALPQLLSKILESKYGVLANTAGDVAAVFHETMEFAGLLRHGVLYDAPTADPAKPDVPSSADVSRTTAPPTHDSGESPDNEPRTSPGGLSDYRIPLTKRRSAVLQLPLPLDATDVARIKKWLDLMEDVITDPDEVPVLAD